MNLPVAVALNLFAADLRVLSFDIKNHLLLVYQSKPLYALSQTNVFDSNIVAAKEFDYYGNQKKITLNFNYSILH